MFYISKILLNYYTNILKVSNITMLSKSMQEKSYPMVVPDLTRVLTTMMSELCIWRPCKVEYLDHLGKLFCL